MYPKYLPKKKTRNKIRKYCNNSDGKSFYLENEGELTMQAKHDLEDFSQEFLCQMKSKKEQSSTIEKQEDVSCWGKVIEEIPSERGILNNKMPDSPKPVKKHPKDRPKTSYDEKINKSYQSMAKVEKGVVMNVSLSKFSHKSQTEGIKPEENRLQRGKKEYSNNIIKIVPYEVPLPDNYKRRLKS